MNTATIFFPQMRNNASESMPYHRSPTSFGCVSSFLKCLVRDRLLIRPQCPEQLRKASEYSNFPLAFSTCTAPSNHAHRSVFRQPIVTDKSFIEPEKTLTSLILIGRYFVKLPVISSKIHQLISLSVAHQLRSKSGSSLYVHRMLSLLNPPFHP